MESTESLTEQEYLDLYNKGYGIYQFSPEMADMIVNVQNKNVEFGVIQEAIGNAIDEVRREKDYLPDWLKEDMYFENRIDLTRETEIDLELGED